MIERSVQIDPEYNHFTGQTVLAAYHARTAMSEMDQSQKMFEDVLQKTQRQIAHRPAPVRAPLRLQQGRRPLYEKLINEVLTADDPDPQQRFTNTIAKRRARRALLKSRMEDCGF